jgi:hypothetical protein
VDLLAALFSPSNPSLTISELAVRIGAPPSTVSREVTKLANAGIVRVQNRGRARMVSANRDLPYSEALTEMLEMTVGAEAAVEEAFERIAGVELVAIFGSWAARRLGASGSAPRDLDVVVVGNPSALAIARAATKVERTVGVAVNPVTVSADEWLEADDTLLADIKSGPLLIVVAHGES